MATAMIALLWERCSRGHTFTYCLSIRAIDVQDDTLLFGAFVAGPVEAGTWRNGFHGRPPP